MYFSFGNLAVNDLPRSFSWPRAPSSSKSPACRRTDHQGAAEIGNDGRRADAGVFYHLVKERVQGGAGQGIIFQNGERGIQQDGGSFAGLAELQARIAVDCMGLFSR